MKNKASRRSAELHDFGINDDKGCRCMTMEEIKFWTDLSKRQVRNRLKAYNRPPPDFHQFLGFIFQYPTQAKFESVVKEQIGDSVNMRLDIERK